MEDEGFTKETKVFNDPIHGHIEFDPLCVAIIDTPQFQRLRHLKQLGTGYFVFPGASHNRFEHSLGVGYLAGELARKLMERQPEFPKHVIEKDVLCVTIAGLCHDLGHGPFSHIFDNKFIPQVQSDNPQLKDWKHEKASVDMFNHLINANENVKRMIEAELSPTDIKFIKEQIAGPPEKKDPSKWNYEGRDKSKSFLYEIVANKRNGIDVDKWDYFARDCHHLGMKNSFDHRRFMQFARVIKVEEEAESTTMICTRDKEVGNLYDMFYVRNNLHRRAYRHKTVIIIEYMLTEALKKADKFLKFSGKNNKELTLSQTVTDMEAYSKVNDSVYHMILLSTSEELKPAREILEQIERRKLYKCVGQSKPMQGREADAKTESKKGGNSAAKIEDKPGEKKRRSLRDISYEIRSRALTESEATTSSQRTAGRNKKQPEKGEELTENQVIEIFRKEIANQESNSTIPLDESDIIVLFSKYDYGKKDKDPIENVRFYSKSDPNVAMKFHSMAVSEMNPQIFLEEYVLVYSRKRDSQSVKAVRKHFELFCEEYGLIEPKMGDPGTVRLTPISGGEDTNEAPAAKRQKKAT